MPQMSTRRVVFSQKYDPRMSRNFFRTRAQVVSLFNTRHRELVPKFCSRGRDFDERQREKLATTITFNESSTFVLSRSCVLTLFAYILRRMDYRRKRISAENGLSHPVNDNASRKGDLRGAHWFDNLPTSLYSSLFSLLDVIRCETILVSNVGPSRLSHFREM